MPSEIQHDIIWDNFRGGNADALELIYEENYSPLFHYGMKFTKDKDQVKDIIHDLFLELIDAGEKLSQTDNVRFYLLKAMRYKTMKALADNQRFVGLQSDNAEFSLLESVEKQLISKEVEATVRCRIISAIKKLSEKQQEIIYLRFYNDMPYAEISEVFGVKIQTVRNLMNRAIQSLKEDFKNKNLSEQMFLFLIQLPL